MAALRSPWPRKTGAAQPLYVPADWAQQAEHPGHPGGAGQPPRPGQPGRPQAQGQAGAQGRVASPWLLRSSGAAVLRAQAHARGPARWGMRHLPVGRIWLGAMGCWALWGVGVLATGAMSSTPDWAGVGICWSVMWVTSLWLWWVWSLSRHPLRWRATTVRQWLLTLWLPLAWAGMPLMGVTAGWQAAMVPLAAAVVLTLVRVLALGISVPALVGAFAAAVFPDRELVPVVYVQEY